MANNGGLHESDVTKKKRMKWSGASSQASSSRKGIFGGMSLPYKAVAAVSERRRRRPRVVEDVTKWRFVDVISPMSSALVSNAML